MFIKALNWYTIQTVVRRYPYEAYGQGELHEVTIWSGVHGIGPALTIDNQWLEQKSRRESYLKAGFSSPVLAFDQDSLITLYPNPNLKTEFTLQKADFNGVFNTQPVPLKLNFLSYH